MSTRMPAPLPEAPFLARFAADVRDGLSKRPRQLPSRYLYDALGSALFEAICELPWYAITRSETRLLADYGDAILAAIPSLRRVVELGPGSARKLSALLSRRPADADLEVHLLDISDAALATTTAGLAAAGITCVTSHRTTYEAGLERLGRGAAVPTLVLCLGSNIGNYDPAAADALLRQIRMAVRPGDALLLGADLVKPADALLRAYDDPLGVTAAFNLNMIARINNELGADFDLAAFDHHARWEPRCRRVEMHLVSRRPQRVSVAAAGLAVELAAGETIWTESSYKYECAEIERLIARAGFRPCGQWVDRSARFALTLAEAG